MITEEHFVKTLKEIIKYASSIELAAETLLAEFHTKKKLTIEKETLEKFREALWKERENERLLEKLIADRKEDLKKVV